MIHLAAMAGVRPSLLDPLHYEDVNVRGTLNLLDLARRNPGQKFVFASSSSVYGNHEKVPFSEADDIHHRSAANPTVWLGGRGGTLWLP